MGGGEGRVRLDEGGAGGGGEGDGFFYEGIEGGGLLCTRGLAIFILLMLLYHAGRGCVCDECSEYRTRLVIVHMAGKTEWGVPYR